MLGMELIRVRLYVENTMCSNSPKKWKHLFLEVQFLKVIILDKESLTAENGRNMEEEEEEVSELLISYVPPGL